MFIINLLFEVIYIYILYGYCTYIRTSIKIVFPTAKYIILLCKNWNSPITVMENEKTSMVHILPIFNILYMKEYTIKTYVHITLLLLLAFTYEISKNYMYYTNTIIYPLGYIIIYYIIPIELL